MSPVPTEPTSISECYKAIQGALFAYANACSLDGKHDTGFSRARRWECQATVEKHIRQLVRMAEAAEYRETCAKADKVELIGKIKVLRDKIKAEFSNGN